MYRKKYPAHLKRITKLRTYFTDLAFRYINFEFSLYSYYVPK